MRTEARIAASMATILKPASEMLPMLGKFVPNGQTCKVPTYVDCLWGMPQRERRPENILWGKCAEENGCKPAVGWRNGLTKADREATNAAEKELCSK